MMPKPKNVRVLRPETLEDLATALETGALPRDEPEPERPRNYSPSEGTNPRPAYRRTFEDLLTGAEPGGWHWPWK